MSSASPPYFSFGHSKSPSPRSFSSATSSLLSTMPVYSVTIKHAGRTHPLSLNTDLPAAAFKQAIYEATGVPVDRMKVMVKGGVLKEDWAKIQVKDNQSFMVIGAAGPLPKAPEKPIVFLEDMDDADLASAVSIFPNL